MSAGEDASAIVARHGLAPHPEGGWFRETWRVEAPDGSRGHATAILYLLEAGTRSHWHRVDAAELWLWHDGAAMILATQEGLKQRLCAASPQGLVPARVWQAAAPEAGWSLVSCIVAPAFEFARLELAAPGWAPPAFAEA